MNKNFKRVIASVSAVCMAAMAMSPLSASAGELLGVAQYNQFDTGVGLPWHVCESAPGEMDFDISGGTFNVTIVNPGGSSRGGEDRWDCQFRHRGLKMNAGDTYSISFELTPSNSGMFYTKIGNLDGNVEVWHNGNTNAGDFGQYWDCIKVSANQTYKLECTFSPTESLDIAEWAFHLGGSGQWTSTDCFPEGTVIKFDNLSLVNTTSDTDDFVLDPHYLYEPSGIEVNQVGYYPGTTKKATLVVSEGDSAAKEFQVLDGSGAAVYTGTSSGYKFDEDSGDYIQILDFSDFKTEGTDYTVVCDGKTSLSFNIGNWVYDSLLTNSLNYYYQNRSGVPIESKYITSGDTSGLSHPGGHKSDVAYVQTKWRDDYASDGSDVEKGDSIDVTGGWYDAGDHGKYVVNGGISVWTLNNMYERSLKNGDADDSAKWNDNSGVMVIPEAGNQIPDILDETKVELDFFLKMQRSDGMVYHKIHDFKWTALAVRPEDDELTRIVKPVTTTASLNLAASAAQASRLWEKYDSSYASTLIEAAKKAYSAAKSNPSMFPPLNQSRGGGAYGDTVADDDFYWAACELYLTTGDQTYYNDMLTYADALKVTTVLAGGENSSTHSSFNWGNTAGLGTLSLALYPDKLSEADFTTVKNSIVAAADEYIGIEDNQGYGIPYLPTGFEDGGNTYTGYEWGSNSMVVNNAMVMAYAYDLTDNFNYINGVTTAMDYIFGRNPLEQSYVTGYGEHATTYPHHRYWSFQIDDTFPMAPAGVLSGGPNSAMQDPYIKGAGYKYGELAPQRCYLDHIESWSTNEVTINWNAPLAWVVSFLEDEADGEGSSSGNDVTTTTTPAVTTTSGNTTTTTQGGTTTTANPDITGIVWGDANCDGKLSAVDLALVKKYLLDMDDLSAQGKANCDLKQDGNVNAMDFVLIKQLVLEKITESELPK